MDECLIGNQFNLQHWCFTHSESAICQQWDATYIWLWHYSGNVKYSGKRGNKFVIDTRINGKASIKCKIDIGENFCGRAKISQKLNSFLSDYSLMTTDKICSFHLIE